MKKISLTKNINFKVIGFSLLIVFGTSCTDYMDTLNQDAKLITDKQLEQDANEGGFLLPLMMNRVVPTITGLQTSQNLMADSYAGYLESPTPFLNNENTMTYFMVNGWVNGAWNQSTNGVMSQWLQMKKNGYDLKYPDLYGIALILKVFAGHRLVDTFGPYPYTKYGSGAEVSFDSEEEAYDAFFADLDQAIANLKAAEAADPNADKTRFVKWDKSSLLGEYTNWIKLANSLRLRLAMRISKVKPALARSEAEKAVSSQNGGLLTNLSFSVVPGNPNPYYTFNFQWTDTRLSASIETYLKGFNDPRLPLYALPATDAAVAGQIKGIRPGVAKPVKATYLNYSTQNVDISSPVKIMDVAESFLLMAEGKLRGWNMNTTKTVQQLYEDGVKASFNALRASGVEDYLQGTSTQMAYQDPKNSANNAAPLTDIFVKWEENVSMERKLERIITQKWIAGFPEGAEAWSEFRRTGYPKMYPIMVSKNPDLPLGTFIKRLTYGTAVTNSSAAAVKVAVDTHLNGKNKASEPIWWDID